MKKYPSNEECISILRNYNTPIHVIRHCEGVEFVSVTIAEELNRKGHDLNIELIRTAAILHDIARMYDNHDIVGADYIKKIGLVDVSNIITLHMRYFNFVDMKDIAEIDIVSIGDKLIREDKYVGITKRMNSIRLKAMKYLTKDRLNEFDIRIIELENFVKAIEKEIGIQIDELMELKSISDE